MFEKFGSPLSKALFKVSIRCGGRPLVVWYSDGRLDKFSRWSSTSWIEDSFPIFFRVELRLAGVEHKNTSKFRLLSWNPSSKKGDMCPWASHGNNKTLVFFVLISIIWMILCYSSSLWKVCAFSHRPLDQCIYISGLVTVRGRF